MIKRFTVGTAGIAIAASLMGTAHAQDATAVYGPVLAEPISAAVVEEDAAQRDASEASQDEAILDGAAVEAADRYPVELLALDAQLAQYGFGFGNADLEQNGLLANTFGIDAAGLVSTGETTGIVTPQSVNPFYGHINPFYGNINPFYGNIDAFWGNINPFWGNINPFWGNINPFYGNINPFYGNIGAFWGNINPFYGNIGAFTSTSAIADFWKTSGAQIQSIEKLYGVASATQIQSAYNTLVAQGQARFSSIVTLRTGKTFSQFASEIFARNGANILDSASLAKLTPQQRAALYLDWHDTLNLYSGVDAVDHWMAAVNWSPSLTDIQGRGSGTIIGIVDGTFSSDADLGSNVVWQGGNTTTLSGHGAGVVSLIAGAHDGQGTMGIAPSVSIATYNPFGADGTASWADVERAIIALENDAYIAGGNQTGYVSIINLSLGEKGWTLSQGLADVLAHPSIAPWNGETIFVVAAGNDGVSQTANINWHYSADPTAIFVGSIDPLGNISNFSNRPGSACLLNNGVCQAGSELFRRFVVAPGELLLVSDGQGGVVRRSGTSFAAPLVSGAISLLHDRWPWLVRNPHETAEIIFRSAIDLGAPGVDPVYGWGLLDVAASQSPLDFNTLTFTSYERSRNRTVARSYSAGSLLGSVPSWWETSSVFFTMFEHIGDTHRDFLVPMSSLQYGKSSSVLGRTERMQDFISTRFANWINSRGADRDGDGRTGFSEVRSNGGEMNSGWSLQYDAIMPTMTQDGAWRPTHGAATLTTPDGTMAFSVGHGQGAMALGGYRFGVMSDHDPFTGGVNPVLGFASGETFAAAQFNIAKGTSVKLGYSENRERWDEVADATPEELLTRRMLGDRPANAVTLDVEQKITDRVSLGVNYTRLREANALLGTQTSSLALLGNGSQTDAMTVSASFDVGGGLSFDLSATGGRTATADGQLFTNAGNIWSTAGQFSATKQGLFSGSDTLRVSIAQPLQIEQGALEFTSQQVIDRDTGEIGPVTQTFGIETQRRFTGEAVYALPLTKSSEFGVFGRYVSNGDFGNGENFIVGGNYSLRF